MAKQVVSNLLTSPEGCEDLASLAFSLLTITELYIIFNSLSIILGLNFVKLFLK